MENSADSLVINASQLLTLAGPQRPRAGKEMGELNALADGAIAIQHGRIQEVGPTRELIKKYPKTENIVDAKHKLVMPGFVDCHTHLVFAGSRENELFMRLGGKSYLEILKEGGGIQATVKATRATDQETLAQLSINRLNQMMLHGTTTVEIKSGYGLDYAAEKKILEVINQLSQIHPMDIVPTFLGAHTIPQGQERKKYMRWLLDEALDEFSELSQYCDVFCEDGAFTLDETRQILMAAKKKGYKLKIHAGQFNDLKAAGMAAVLGARSADHLEKISEEQLHMMKESNTLGVLMPGVPFFLQSAAYPDARLMIEIGVPVALATDFNPGSCTTFSMQMIIALACFYMKMSPPEAITAATINAAWALDRGNSLGSLEEGKWADIIILDVSESQEIPYYFGTNLISRVIKRGHIY